MDLALALNWDNAGRKDVAELLCNNWQKVLPILPAYIEDVQTFLAMNNLHIELSTLESILFELQELIPEHVSLIKYRISGHHRTVLLYFGLDFQEHGNRNKVEMLCKREKTILGELPRDLDELFENALTGTCVTEEWSQELEALLTEDTSLGTLARQNALAQEPVPYIAVCELSARGCAKSRTKPCDKIHFQQIIRSNTDINLGDCSYLNTCFKGKNCRYVHYHITIPETIKAKTAMQKIPEFESLINSGEPTEDKVISKPFVSLKY